MDEVVFIEADCKTWEKFSQGLHLLESFIQKVSVNFFCVFMCDGIWGCEQWTCRKIVCQPDGNVAQLNYIISLLCYDRKIKLFATWWNSYFDPRIWNNFYFYLSSLHCSMIYLVQYQTAITVYSIVPSYCIGYIKYEITVKKIIW